MACEKFGLERRAANFPFAPARWPFFYGWVIVAAAGVGIVASIPGQTMGVGVFTDYLIDSLGISRFMLSLAYMFGTIISSFILPFAGRVLDKIGARPMVVFSSVGLGVALVLLAGSSMAVYRESNRNSVTAFAVILIVFLMLRFFGQGCLTMVSRVVVGKWFNHHRGLASAILGTFVAFGFSISPAILNKIVERFSWQGACLLLALFAGVGMTVVGWLFFRDNPEECGLQMDGEQSEEWHRRMAKRVPDIRHEFTQREAIRDYAFWVFNIGVSSQSLLITAFTFHVASIGAEAGLSREQAYAIFLYMPFFGTAANLIGGWLSDRIHLKWILIAMMFTEAIGMCGMMRLDNFTGQALFFVGIGISGGLFAVLTTVAWPRFYGREHLGAISGVNMSIMVFASAIGPVLFSAMRALTGDYTMVIVASWFLPVMILLAAFKAKNPQETWEAKG